MIIGIGQSVFMILAAVVGYYIPHEYFSRKYTSQMEDKKSSNIVITIVTLFIAAFLILQPILWPRLSWHLSAPFGYIIQGIGFISFLLGTMLNWQSRKHLGKHYTQGSLRLKEHTLIDTGPYKYVCHPLFSAYYLLVFGIFLFNPAVETVLLLLLCPIYFTWWAKEDEAILSDLPGYTAYRARTPRFFPHLRKQAMFLI